MVEKWILVVEDDARVARTVTDGLRKIARTVVAATAQQAMLLLEEPRNWAMALIDLDLHKNIAGEPTDDRAGMAVALHVRWRFPDVAVMLWTGHSGERLEEEACARGIGWFDKPMSTEDRDELIGIAKDACDRPAVMDEADALARAALHTVLGNKLEHLPFSPTQTRIFITYAVMTWDMEQVPERRHVGQALGISEGTYKKHVNKMKKKLEGRDLADEMPGILRETAQGLARICLEQRQLDRPPRRPGDTGRSGTRARVDRDAEAMQDAAEEDE